jgi:NADH-ubiquinone oxidoreductase chain 5
MHFAERSIFLVVFAAITRSAQVSFSSQLPTALAVPTPVPALVHSSAVVTAIVYLFILLVLFFGY